LRIYVCIATAIKLVHVEISDDSLDRHTLWNSLTSDNKWDLLTQRSDFRIQDLGPAYLPPLTLKKELNLKYEALGYTVFCPV